VPDISIILRVADDDFYRQFLYPMQKERELTKFIVRALQGYYSDMGVKEAIDEYLEGIDPMAGIFAQIGRIQAQISKDIAITEAFGEEVNKEAKNINAEYDARLKNIETQIASLGDIGSLVSRLENMLNQSESHVLIGDASASDREEVFELLGEPEKELPLLVESAVSNGEDMILLDDNEPVADTVEKPTVPSSFAKMASSLKTAKKED
jgi:hypothetical protein